jgi:hypothetical protein
VDTLRDPLKVGGGYERGRVELNALLFVAREHAVEKRDVEVKIQIETAAKALKKRDGATFGALDALALCARAIAGEHGIGEDPHDGAEHVLFEAASRRSS